MARTVATGAGVRVAALVFVCLGCCFPQTRANAAVSTQFAAPNLTGAAAMADGSSSKPYVAIVKECFPFAFPDPTRTSGVSGYLIDQMNALNSPDSPMHIKYTMTNTSYTGTLEQLRTGEYNMAVSCFTRTLHRELDVVDFSWSVFKAGVCLLQERREVSRVLFTALFTHDIISIFCGLFIAIFVFANFIWAAEHYANPDFRGDGTYPDGIWHSLWFITVTFTTVGYGEKTPITNVGKTFTLIWMFVGLGFYCLFTGSLAAYLTNSAAIPKPYTWKEVGDNILRVGVVGGSSYEDHLKAKAINIHKRFKTEQEAYAHLKRGEIDIMVADWPIVYADMRRGLISSTKYVCGEIGNDESFGIGFPNNGNLNEVVRGAMTKVNTGIINWEKSQTKLITYEKYFVDDDDAGEDSNFVDPTPPTWTSEVIIAFTLALALVLCWFGIWVRKKHLERKERLRRLAAGEEEEKHDDLVGGMAKAKDLKVLMDQIESLEARLVDAKVIKPKPKLLERWKTRGREQGKAMVITLRHQERSHSSSSTSDGDAPHAKQYTNPPHSVVPVAS